MKARIQTLLMTTLDNPLQCKLIPDKSQHVYFILSQMSKESKWDLEYKFDESEKHRLVKFTCTENRPPKNLFEVRMEMGSEVMCKQFRWIDIPLCEYETGFKVSKERYEEVLTMPFPFFEDRRLEIMSSAHYTPGHTCEYAVGDGHVFVDLVHLTLEGSSSRHFPNDDRFSIKYEDSDFLVMKFKTHNERDKYCSNDPVYRELKDRYGWTEHLGKFFKIRA